MLSETAMWIIGIVIVLLPFAISLIFNGRNQSDARGRRINTTWQGKTLR